MSEGDQSHFDINTAISNVLRYGVLLGTVIIATGVILLFVGYPPSGFPDSVERLVITNFGRPTTQIDVLLAGIARLDPVSILELGLIILLATPLVRVATSALFFAAERDGVYVAITLSVLVVLLFSIFVIGPAQAGTG